MLQQETPIPEAQKVSSQEPAQGAPGEEVLTPPPEPGGPPETVPDHVHTPADKPGAGPEEIDAEMVPPTETSQSDQGRSITVRRGLRKFSGLRGKLGIDDDSLKEAGVLRTGEAQAGQEAAIAADGDSGKLAEETSGLDENARRRAGQIHNGRELVGSR